MVTRRHRVRTQAVMLDIPMNDKARRAARFGGASDCDHALLRWRPALAFELLAQFIGALLQILLQLPLLLLEHLGVGGWTFVGLLEAVARVVGERQREGDCSGGEIDRLDLQHLALLELTDELGCRLVVGHATVGKAGKERAADGRFFVDDDACAVLQLQWTRQRDPEQLFRFAFRLDQGCGHDRLTGLGAGVLSGEADFFGAGVIALAAEFRPWRIDELWHFGRSARSRRLRSLSGCRRRLLCGGCRRLLGGWSSGSCWARRSRGT